MSQFTPRQWYKIATIVLGTLSALIVIWAVPEPMKSTLTVLIGMVGAILAIVLGVDNTETRAKLNDTETRITQLETQTEPMRAMLASRSDTAAGKQ